MKYIAAIIFSVLLLVGHDANASSVDTYSFSKPEYQIRFQDMAKILRCPKCQNQNLADSNSIISQDLRRQLHRLIEEGRSDEQIIEYMVMRYGDYVLYKPKFDKVTYFLWLGPFGFAALGLLILIIVVVRQRRKRGQSSEIDINEQTLNVTEQAKLDKILKKSN